MAAPIRSARVAPRPAGPGARRTTTAARPNLRVVDDARLSLAHRRRRARLIVVAAAVFAAGFLFLLAAGNAMLVTGQNKIDHLQKEVVAAQARYSENRLKVAQLEAPSHVVDVAQKQLGMVPPPGVTYLSPSEAMAAQVGGGKVAQQQQQTASHDGGTPWAAVKPYLGGRP